MKKVAVPMQRIDRLFYRIKGIFLNKKNQTIFLKFDIKSTQVMLNFLTALINNKRTDNSSNTLSHV